MPAIDTAVWSIRIALSAWAVLELSAATAGAQDAATPAEDLSKTACFRAVEGSVVPEPEDLRSENGVLKIGISGIGGGSFDAKAGTLNGMFDFDGKAHLQRVILDPSTGLVLPQ
jgi:hypothetical protein